jgi:hypothetical protein
MVLATTFASLHMRCLFFSKQSCQWSAQCTVVIVALSWQKHLAEAGQLPVFTESSAYSRSDGIGDALLRMSVSGHAIAGDKTAALIAPNR